MNRPASFRARAAGAALASLVAPLLAQSDDLTGVAGFEARRMAVMARVAPAVCGVMAMRDPGGGSGVVIDPAGHLLTNFHCVGQEERQVMKIGLPDGFLYQADVLGIDPGGDVALLRLRPRTPGQVFPYVELGDSDQLKVGEITYAMGNPFLLATDFKPTVTMGIVSGTHRYQPGTQNRFLVYPDCIQVDTPINPGNSGGPLFNEQGQLVGINGRISVGERGRVNVGVGFAISINQIKNFLPDLRAGRHCEHGTLDMNAWFMTDPNVRDRQGVFVQGMLEDSVAAKAGIELQDELLEFNGLRISSANQLASMIGVLPAGFEVHLLFRRFNIGTGSYDAPRAVRITLAAMDTGSGRAKKERVAAESFRAWERDRILARCPRATAAVPAAGYKATRRDLATGRSGLVRVLRLGANVRVEIDEDVVVLKDGKAWRKDGATWRELDLDWRVHLERLRDLHPILGLPTVHAVLQPALLEGGHLVEGRVTNELGLPDEGRRAVFLDDQTGLPIGCRFRSPQLKELVEYRLVPGQRLVLRIGNKDAFEEQLIGGELAITPDLFEVRS